MVDNQTNIFEMLYPTFTIDKPIRTIELFGGYGSQLLSLKYLNADVEQWKLCEWAIKSIQAYKDIHFEEDDFDYSEELSLEEVKKYLLEKGISSNYNEPMTQQQINRLNDKQARTIYNNIQATHNLVNIQQVKGKDLEIIDKDKYTYIMTYSFPCQDLSLAGKGKGMSDTSTRSGMLWEVERILTECKEKPQILLMENVPQVHGQDNIDDFNKWQYSLEAMGYKNYWKDLIATDYGIPQTRNRCFMISILGDYNYTFPKPIPLKLKLKDMLEDNVDERYFLSDKQIKDVQSWKAYEKPLENMEKTDKNNISPTLTTRSGAYAAGMVLVKDKCIGTYQYSKSDNFMKGKDRLQLGKETSDTLQTTPKEGVVINTIDKPKGLTQTLSTKGGENNGVVVNMKVELCNNLIKEGKVKENDVIRHSYTTSRMNGDMKDLKQNNLSPTLDTRCDCLGVVNNMRIRKLTPRECFRLMGVKDKDYEKIAKNQSDSSLYHLAGDSIVVNVLMAIFKELL